MTKVATEAHHSIDGVQIWYGSSSSNLPILISVCGETPEAAIAGVRRITDAYPASIHGTTVVPPVLTVTGIWKANVYLIPGKNGDLALWPILAPV